jgi:hypothetical protein
LLYIQHPTQDRGAFDWERSVGYTKLSQNIRPEPAFTITRAGRKSLRVLKYFGCSSPVKNRNGLPCQFFAHFTQSEIDKLIDRSEIFAEHWLYGHSSVSVFVLSIESV